MKNFYRYLLWALFTSLLLVTCSNDNEEVLSARDLDVRFELPSLIEVSKGEEFDFKVIDGMAPTTDDLFLLEARLGVSLVCHITASTSDSFTVRLSEECESGDYNVYIKRGDFKKKIGSFYINVVDKLDFEPDPETTVYGVVAQNGVGVAGVVVSDGDIVTQTDERGIYQLVSKKRQGLVFISVPSGYEVPSVGILPQFHHALKAAPSTPERVDFSLIEVKNQEQYKVFMLGDMHLANRTGDLGQFEWFAEDLNKTIGQLKGEKYYAITLGDMTWDIYWYANDFCFKQYIDVMNSKFKNLQVFHTMGNHDNDYKALSDMSASSLYLQSVAPTYYSFNIGKVHYVVLDNIDCSGYDGSTSRNYVKRIADEQLAWLEKDLSFVDKSTPIVMTFHAQMFYPLTATTFRYDHDVENSQKLLALLEGYKVHLVTGHTHMMFNVTAKDAITEGRDFYEHNAGSVCGSWWWSGNLTPGIFLGQDGSPAGYGIWNISGTDFKWVYKATGRPEEYQFRSYDLNNIHFSTGDIPKCPAAVQKSFEKYVHAYPKNTNNEVLINVWNWSANWTIEVEDETGKKLEAVPVRAYDPLHIVALTIPRFNSSSLSAAPNFTTVEFSHFFKVKTDDANVDLKITVTDECGHSWTENMARPKAFSVDDFRSKQ